MSLVRSLRMAVGACAILFLLATLAGCSSSKTTPGAENCANRIDDDGDGVVDCLDSDCRENALCQGNPEICGDGLDNDLDGKVDCLDTDCQAQPACSEMCGNGIDDNGDTLKDCEDPLCHGKDPACGEVCGDGQDNDGDNLVDCKDPDCADVIPPCGAGPGPDGTMCAYGGAEPHVCACADGKDNDNDGTIDGADLHCFGPFDDDEGSYATGIPGDNKGSHGDVECPFDGNSGIGNDDVCCNPADPTQNVTPNGCDNLGCCEVDINRNTTGEHVFVRDTCVFAPACGSAGKHGCACAAVGDCDNGQYCLKDDDTGAGFCSTCAPCVSNQACENPCDCGEQCFGGFRQPDNVCLPGGTCPAGVTPCPNGDADCDTAANETCQSGCCRPVCEEGVVPCQTSADCPTDVPYFCITGCCIEVPL